MAKPKKRRLSSPGARAARVVGEKVTAAARTGRAQLKDRLLPNTELQKEEERRASEAHLWNVWVSHEERRGRIGWKLLGTVKAATENAANLYAIKKFAGKLQGADPVHPYHVLPVDYRDDFFGTPNGHHRAHASRSAAANSGWLLAALGVVLSAVFLGRAGSD